MKRNTDKYKQNRGRNAEQVLTITPSKSDWYSIHPSIPIPSYPSYPIPLYPIPSHPSHPIVSYPISSIPSYLILSHRTLIFYAITIYPIPSHSPHLISSHFTSSHITPSYLILSIHCHCYCTLFLFLSTSLMIHLFVFQPESNTLKCFHSTCSMECHTLCLAQRFLTGSDKVLPIDGACPSCKKSILWGDLIRYKMGCYQTLEEVREQSFITGCWGGGVRKIGAGMQKKETPPPLDCEKSQSPLQNIPKFSMFTYTIAYIW